MRKEQGADVGDSSAVPPPPSTAAPQKLSVEAKAGAAIAVIALFVAVALYATSAASFFQKYWVDDAAISFTFARNIADGYGSVVYPGGERLEGFSNPTWVALLVALRKIGVEPFAGSQYLGLIFSLGVLLIFGLFAWRAEPDGRRPWPLAVAALFVGGHAGFAIWNQSGMENSLYSVLLAGALLLVTREAADEKLFPWSAAALAALALTRPEGAAHAVIAGGYLLLADLTIRKRPTRRLAVWAALFAALFGAYQLWHYLFFARPFPNTYYAKVQPALGPRLLNFNSNGWRYITGFLGTYSLWPLLPLCLPAFFGKRWREAAYFAATAVFLAFFTLVSNGDWMKSWRFLSSFPIPLGLLIGLSAIDVGEWARRAARKSLDARSATLAALAASALFVILPAGWTYAASANVLSSFEERREVSAPGIGKRAKWWSEIAHKLARRPEDLTMCDMDMGGTSYNWTGKILDIGYLLDASMAQHRYTREWPRMMDRYFFEERRPDLIHIRRDWGKATTVPGNPKFARQYLELPEDRHFSTPPNGNYVRRDLFEIDGKADWPAPPLTLAGTLTLLDAEIPAALDPGRKTPIFLTWRRVGDADGCRLSVGLAPPGETPTMVEHAPLMGWAATRHWPGDRDVREVVYLEAPKTVGAYDVYVGVESCGDTGAVEKSPIHEGSRKLPLTVEVDRAAARRLAERLLAEARELTNGELADLAAAKARWERAAEIVGEKSVADAVKEIEQRRFAGYLRLAEKAFGAGDFHAAADAVAPAWRLSARDAALRKLGSRIAEKLYARGRDEQKSGAFQDAYRDFSDACRAQPSNAWARRRAEEVRMGQP